MDRVGNFLAGAATGGDKLLSAMKAPLSLLVVALLLLAPAVGAAEKPADAALLADYAKQVEAELRGDILPFWLKHTRDPRGGFYGYIDNDLVVHPDAPRGALLTTRVLWTFSAAYRRYHDPAYLEMAHWAYNDLLARFWDRQYGGLYWTIKADGTPLDTRKIVYVQAFGIYGLSEYYRATNDRSVLDRALDLYQAMEEHAHDHGHLGYFEEFTRDWQISRARGPGKKGGGSAMGSLDQKSQNVHLHILEAYTNLYRAWPDPGLRKNLYELVDVMLHRILDPKTHHLRLFLAEDWTPSSDTVSFGHDIEFSWLIVDTAEALGDDKLLATARTEAVAIARATLKEGVDPDGGVLDEAGPHGYTRTFKEWWPQAEATTGFLGAYQISGDETFLRASRHSWEFIETHLIDRKNGEWFMGVSRDGKTKPPVKVDLWKCPYHNSRACLELLERIHQLASKP